MEFEKGIEKGIEQGMGIGEKNNQLGIVRKMRIKGFSIADIMDITGLRREEIEGVVTTSHG